MTAYYSDITPPAAYTGTMNTAIAGLHTVDRDRMKYALYEDSATWTAWVSWAEQNAIKFDRTRNYSARAFQVIGYWATIPIDGLSKSFMCV
jgi:hypothetical protein